MSKNDSSGQPEKGIEPVNQAVHQLAMSVHDDIVQDLDRSSNEMPIGFEDRLAQHRKNYPHLLFGELAMYLADIQLPIDASAPDRARGIIQALRRISETPSLFEAITNAPYTQELATGIIPELPTNVERNEREIIEVVDLQRKVAEAGYLDYTMIPDNRVTQLQYETTPTFKTRRRSRSKTTEPAIITLKLVQARTNGWNVKRYNEWSLHEGYSDYIGERRVHLVGAFNLIAVNSSLEVPPNLMNLIGNTVKFGQVSTGTQLKLEHTFSRRTQEVPGHEPDINYQTLTLQAVLKQAYLGDLTSYPLFP